MKAFTRFALAIAIAAFAWSPVRSETPDPPPVVADDDERPNDGRELIGVQRVTVCENGVCRVVLVEVPDAAPAAAPAPVAASAACPCGESCPCAGQATAVASKQSALKLFERVRSWYPGKLIQSFRASRSASRGCN